MLSCAWRRETTYAYGSYTGFLCEWIYKMLPRIGRPRECELMLWERIGITIPIALFPVLTFYAFSTFFLPTTAHILVGLLLNSLLLDFGHLLLLCFHPWVKGIMFWGGPSICVCVLSWCCDTLCTFGFTDDIMVAWCDFDRDSASSLSTQKLP